MKDGATIPRRRVTPWILTVALATSLAPGLWAAQAKPLTVLEGKLLTTPGDCPMVRIGGQERTLTADTPYLYATLQDKRLEGFEVRLEGIPMPDGSFQVHWLYTIHNGKLFRVRYFCPRCNIVALGPGNCVCCQQPTELQQIPVDKPED